MGEQFGNPTVFFSFSFCTESFVPFDSVLEILGIFIEKDRSLGDPWRIKPQVDVDYYFYENTSHSSW